MGNPYVPVQDCFREASIITSQRGSTWHCCIGLWFSIGEKQFFPPVGLDNLFILFSKPYLIGSWLWSYKKWHGHAVVKFHDFVTFVFSVSVLSPQITVMVRFSRLVCLKRHNITRWIQVHIYGLKTFKPCVFFQSGRLLANEIHAFPFWIFYWMYPHLQSWFIVVYFSFQISHLCVKAVRVWMVGNAATSALRSYVSVDLVTAVYSATSVIINYCASSFVNSFSLKLLASTYWLTLIGLCLLHHSHVNEVKNIIEHN